MRIRRLKGRLLLAESQKATLGQSLVEVALFIPILLMILVIAIDLGRLYLGWVTLNNVTRIGANFAATNPTAWQGTGNAAVKAQYQTLMLNDAGSIDCDLPSPLPDPNFADSSYTVGARVVVTIPCTFHLITPVLNTLIGDGSGAIAVSGTTTFGIRASYAGTDPIGGGGTGGSPGPTQSPSPTSTPVPTPTAVPTPTPSGSPGGSPNPTPSPSPTPPIVTFYGTPTSPLDSFGGGPSPAPGPNIVGLPGFDVTFTNTTPGGHTSCLWNFGDGGTSTSCANTVSYTYPYSDAHTSYTVTLSIDGGTLPRSGYVQLTCKVPAFIGTPGSAALNVWTAAGFNAANFKIQGNASDPINQQDDSSTSGGGIVLPPNSCATETVTVHTKKA